MHPDEYSFSREEQRASKDKPDHRRKQNTELGLIAGAGIVPGAQRPGDNRVYSGHDPDPKAGDGNHNREDQRDRGEFGAAQLADKIAID